MSSTTGSRRSLSWLLTALLVCAGGCWSTPADAPLATPRASASRSAASALSPAQVETAQARAALLVSLVGTAPDPVEPQGPVREGLARLSRALGSWPRVAVVDGVPYPGLEVRGDGEGCSIAPASSPAETAGIRVAPATADRTKLLAACGGPVQAEVMGLVLDALAADPSARLPDSKIRSLLDTKRAAGTLTSYRYDPSHDTLDLTLPEDPVPWRMNPRVEGRTLALVLAAASAPRAAAQNVVDSWHERMGKGDVLVVTTTGTDRLRDFVSRPSLAADLAVLTNPSLSRDEKLLHLALGDAPPPSATDAAAPAAVAAPSAGAASDLLDRPDTIVPPSRRLTFLRGPDYNVRPHLDIHAFGREPFDLRAVKDPRGPFRAFHECGYDPVEATTVDWGEPFVERLARILDDPSQSVVVFHTHGDDRALLAEMYDLGAADVARDAPTLADFHRRMGAFKARVALLKQTHGDEAIRVFYHSASLSPADQRLMGADAALVPADYAHLLTEKSRFGIVAVTNDFFAAHPTKKALFILMACYGGSVAPSIAARVVLAPDPRSFTTGQLFVDSDLTKLGPCLVQTKEALPVKTSKRTMRTYDLVSAFKAPPPWREGMRPAEEASLVERFTAEPDRMASIRLFGAAGRTVTPSPHVETGDGGRVVFNAPMDASIPAGTVVRVSCPDDPALVAKFKDLSPTWKGDRELLLPWKGKVYRDWKPADLSGAGRPSVKVAVVTVSHRTAVSAVSRIELTGNPDVCTLSGFTTPDAWKDFAPLRLNATRARSDFVMLFPCLDEEPPPPTDRVVDGEDPVRHRLFPSKESGFKDLLLDGAVVVDCTSTYEAYRQAKKGGAEGFTYVNVDDTTPLAAFGSHYAYDRETQGDEHFHELFHDGAVALRDERGVDSGLQLYGDHSLAWTSTDKVVYDGTTFDEGTLGQCVMTATALFSRNAEGELRRDGRPIGRAAQSCRLTCPENVRLSNHGYEEYPYGVCLDSGGPGAYGYQRVWVFRSNAAWLDPEGRGRMYRGEAGRTEDLGPASNVFLFGDHVVTVREDPSLDRDDSSCHRRILYDGLDFGEGDQPAIFGDHLAFVSSRDGRGWAVQQDRTSPVGQAVFSNGQRYVFLDGVYVDVAERLRLPPAGYEINAPRFYEGVLAFDLSIRPLDGSAASRHLILDWRDAGPVKPGYFRFQGHELWTRNVGGTEHVVYDGRDLGRGWDARIGQDHIAFWTHGTDGPTALHFDGALYPPNASMYANVRFLYKYWLETKVPTSPYGTVTFDPTRRR